MDAALAAALLGALMNAAAIVFGIFRLGRAVERFEHIGAQQAHEITELKDTVKVIGELVTKFAVQTHRQDTLEDRINRQEQTIEDLRRGEGYILGLNTHLPKP